MGFIPTCFFSLHQSEVSRLIFEWAEENIFHHFSCVIFNRKYKPRPEIISLILISLFKCKHINKMWCECVEMVRVVSEHNAKVINIWKWFSLEWVKRLLGTILVFLHLIQSVSLHISQAKLSKLETRNQNKQMRPKRKWCLYVSFASISISSEWSADVCSQSICSSENTKELFHTKAPMDGATIQLCACVVFCCVWKRKLFAQRPT